VALRDSGHCDGFDDADKDVSRRSPKPVSISQQSTRYIILLTSIGSRLKMASMMIQLKYEDRK
jgi:hypothetical protein